MEPSRQSGASAPGLASTLPATIVLLRLIVLPSRSMPPPSPLKPIVSLLRSAVLPVTVTLFRLWTAPKANRPPPPSSDEFPLIVTSVRVAGPPLSMPPPKPSAWLPLTVTPVSVRVALWFWMPPPFSSAEPVLPPRIVTPAIWTAIPEATSTTRPPVSVLFPWTVAPWVAVGTTPMVRLSSTSRSPSTFRSSSPALSARVRTYVTPSASRMESDCPATKVPVWVQPPKSVSVFADWIASRREQLGPVLYSSLGALGRIVAAPQAWAGTKNTAPTSEANPPISRALLTTPPYMELQPAPREGRRPMTD